MWGAQGWNQWAVQPAAFNDVPHEQIDWAALAKQWIQMQQSKPSESSVAPVIPPPPPPPPPMPPSGHVSSTVSSGGINEDTSSQHLKPSVASKGSVCETFQKERTTEDGSANWKWEASAANDIDERVWTPSVCVESPSVIPSKETYDYGHIHDNSPLAMQSIDYNHMSHSTDFSYQVYSSENPYEYWSQVNATAPLFLKKEPVSTSSAIEESAATQIDAAKRKQLPAWIREGLEKMEEQRLKKMKKEKAEKERVQKQERQQFIYQSVVQEDSLPKETKSKFESDSDPEPESANIELKSDRSSPASSISHENKSSSPFVDLTDEEQKEEMMLNIRRVLTELLLTITNAEMFAIAKEVLQRERARQLASTEPQTSVAPGLRGLVSYETESEASDEDVKRTGSDDELNCKVKERKKLFTVSERKNPDFEKQELDGKQEAVKNLNEIKSPRSLNASDSSEVPVKCEKEKPSEEHKTSLPFVPSYDEILENAVKIPLINDLDDDDDVTPLVTDESNCVKEMSSWKETAKKDIPSASHSPSSSSDSESECSAKNENMSGKKRKKRDEQYTRKKSRERYVHRRSTDRESGSSGNGTSSHKRYRDERYEYGKKKSSSKQKRKDRSDYSPESSSSSGGARKRRKSKSYLNAHYRSHENRSRRHKKSTSPRPYHSRDSYGHKEFCSFKYEKKKSEQDKRYYDYKRSPSPYKHSEKLPKKYRPSRSPSSDYDTYGKKLKKSQYH